MKILILLLLASSTAFAQSSSRFEITRGVIAGGGTTPSVSSHFQLSGTVAQPLAAVPASAHFSIQGGFWIRPAPIFFAPQQIGTNFVVSIQSEPGKTYTVQYQTALGSSWLDVVTVTGNGSVITVTNALLGLPQQFYQLVEQ